MEEYTSLVSSRGILKSCRSRNRHPVSSNSAIDPDLLRDHISGGSIYVCTDALQNFSTKILPQIDRPFVLVTGDSDRSVDSLLLQDEGIGRVLGSRFLIEWYAQNLVATHPKLRPLPIGQDYHTMWERPGLWGLKSIAPMAQEHLLFKTLEQSSVFASRYINAYCNWHFAIERGDRRECFDKVQGEACIFEPNPLPRFAAWARQAECMFVLSPAGAGIDCHRTWEALALGCVPVVKSTPLRGLFDGLPVLVVDDWCEVTSEALGAVAREINEMEFDFSKLFLGYWMSQIEQKRPDTIRATRFAEFRRMLVRFSA